MCKNCGTAKCNSCKCNEELIPTDRVYYSGPRIPDFDINPGDILTGIIEKIFSFLGSFTPPDYDIVKGGVSTLVGNGVNKVFSFPHNLGVLPDSVVVSPTNKNSSDNFSVDSNINNISVTYSIAPAQGETLTYNYIALKNKS